MFIVCKQLLQNIQKFAANFQNSEYFKLYENRMEFYGEVEKIYAKAKEAHKERLKEQEELEAKERQQEEEI